VGNYPLPISTLSGDVCVLSVSGSAVLIKVGGAKDTSFTKGNYYTEDTSDRNLISTSVDSHTSVSFDFN